MKNKGLELGPSWTNLLLVRIPQVQQQNSQYLISTELLSIEYEIVSSLEQVKH